MVEMIVPSVGKRTVEPYPRAGGRAVPKPTGRLTWPGRLGLPRPRAVSTAAWGHTVPMACPPSPSALVPGKNGRRDISARDGSGSAPPDRPGAYPSSASLSDCPIRSVQAASR